MLVRSATLPLLRFVKAQLVLGGKNIREGVSNARNVTQFAFFCIGVEDIFASIC